MTATKEIKNNNYIDITKDFIKNNKLNNYKVLDKKYFKDSKGIKYKVDNKNVVLDYSKKEKEIAIWLGKTFGGKIYMLPRINKPDGIMTADYLFKNEYWDLKSLTGCGKRIIEDAIKKKKRQSKNFIFDITNSNIQENDLLRQLKKIYNSETTKWVNKIIVKKNKNVIIILKRKD